MEEDYKASFQSKRTITGRRLFSQADAWHPPWSTTKEERKEGRLEEKSTQAASQHVFVFMYSSKVASRDKHY
jgi:hypothetical protein